MVTLLRMSFFGFKKTYVTMKKGNWKFHILHRCTQLGGVAIMHAMFLCAWKCIVFRKPHINIKGFCVDHLSIDFHNCHGSSITIKSNRNIMIETASYFSFWPEPYIDFKLQVKAHHKLFAFWYKNTFSLDCIHWTMHLVSCHTLFLYIFSHTYKYGKISKLSTFSFMSEIVVKYFLSCL